MEVQITGIDHNGRGITKIDNKICFVENALKGEKVEINVTLNKKKYMEAKTLNILENSDDRCEPICKYASICGGCNIMHLNYEKQLEYKKDKVDEIIRKFTKSNILINDILASKKLNYRNKLTLHVDKRLGLYENKTNRLVEIDNCFIVNNKINQIISKLKQMDLSNINEIIIRASFNTDDTMIVLDVNDKINEQKFIDSFKEVTSLIQKQNNNYYVLNGKASIIEKIGNLKFFISPDSFFQVNTIQAKILYDEVKKNLDKNDKFVIDLYCGTGTIGLYISDIVEKVVGIEINKYAVEDANKNKQLNNINNIQFICGDSGRNMGEFKKIDAIIVDPPRSGLGEYMLNQLLNIKAKKIIYVSCDPVTLARDLNILSTAYDVKNLTPVDMFPQTSHVECVCVLKSRQILIE